MSKLYLPPIKLDGMDRDPAAPAIGVPVAPFPRWMRCSLCDTMATVESGVFKLVQDPYRPDKTEYVHQGCLKSQGWEASFSTFSDDFLLACREGHLTDFPWLEFVHKGNVPCRPATLSMREFGASGDASDIVVKCHSCGIERRMADAFDPDAAIRLFRSSSASASDSSKVVKSRPRRFCLAHPTAGFQRHYLRCPFRGQPTSSANWSRNSGRS